MSSLDPSTKLLEKKELQSLKQKIAFKPKWGKESFGIIPMINITGKTYGKKLPKWWVELVDKASNNMYMLDFFKGNEVVLYRPLKDSDWIYAIYRGMRRSIDDGECPGRTERIYYFQTSLTEMVQIKYNYISKDIHGKIPEKCGLEGGSWSGGDIAVFQESQFPSKR